MIRGRRYEVEVFLERYGSVLYQSPLTDLSPCGPEAIFTTDEGEKVVAVLDSVRATGRR